MSSFPPGTQVIVQMSIESTYTHGEVVSYDETYGTYEIKVQGTGDVKTYPESWVRKIPSWNSAPAPLGALTQIVWVAFSTNPFAQTNPSNGWAIIGVYSTEDAAVAAKMASQMPQYATVEWYQLDQTVPPQ